MEDIPKNKDFITTSDGTAGQKTVADIQILAFGTPRPLHRQWIRHCSNIRAVFHLITDKPSEWEKLIADTHCGGNIRLVKISVEGFFARIAQALWIEDLEKFRAAYSGRMDGRFDGYTANNFKPLLAETFPLASSYPFFGWMDWDVFLTNELLYRLQAWAPNCTDMSIFTPRGIRWEQFKLFPRSAQKPLGDEFRQSLLSGRYSGQHSFDVQFVYDDRRTSDSDFCPITQEDIAVHWDYLEVIGRESQPNKLDVVVEPATATLSDARTGRSILMFIADREVKTMTEREVEECLTIERRFLKLPYQKNADSAPARVATTQKGQQRTPTARRHCIVTPDFIGPIKNGGIGTACYHLARFLREEKGHHVSVLFTGPLEEGAPEHWRMHYAEKPGFAFYTLEDLPQHDQIPHHNVFWFHSRSFRIDQWLRRQSFDSIHFQDWQANGFVPMQAKNSGLAYQGKLLTCTIHSPQEWIDEGSLRFPSPGPADLLQRYAERYAASNADLAVFPSRHMLDWAVAHSWNVRRAEIAPYLWMGEGADAPSADTHSVTEFSFFGRLETRKGLEIFIAALELLVARVSPASLPPVSFLGKPGLVADGCARDYVMASLKRLGIAGQVLDNLDSQGALDYIASHKGCVAVIASLSDNLPYAVIECLQKGVPLLASRTGGIPELISSPEHLFDPTANSLAQALERTIAKGLPPTRSCYSPQNAAAKWSLVAEETAPARKLRHVEEKDVTVCIAHFNHGRYLPEALRSLDQQTVDDFDVVIVDDGSTDPGSIQVLEEMRHHWAHKRNWQFVRTENNGVGHARNTAAELAQTPFVVFFDADNIAAPNMVERMVVAMRNSRADCLTCYMEAFTDGEDGARKLSYRYLPTGPCIEAGAIINIFGDANCIIRRDVFRNIGAFSPNRRASFEDWELFARLSLSGTSLDVIPEFLHYYRHLESGFSRITSTYRNHCRVLDVYANSAPAWVAPLLSAFCSPQMSAASHNRSTPALLLLNEQEVRRQIALIKRSTSWRITAPLRWCGDFYTALKASRGSRAAQASGVEALAQYLRDLQGSTSWRITAPLRRIFDQPHRQNLGTVTSPREIQ